MNKKRTLVYILVGLLVVIDLSVVISNSLPGGVQESKVLVDTRISLKAAHFDTALGEPTVPLDMRAPSNHNLFLVQFDGPVGYVLKKSLESQGFDVISYVPHNAYLVAGDRNSLNRLYGLSHVLWVGDYHPFYKISPNISPYSGYNTVTVMVAGTPTSKSTVSELLSNYNVIGGGRNFRGDFTITLFLTYEEIINISKMNNVYWIEPWTPATIFDETASEIVGGYWSANSPYDGPGSYVNSLGWNGTGVIVSVTDTGLADGNIPVDHPDFQDRVVGGIDYTNSGSWEDGHGHGTHVAGIVAGDGSRGTKELYPEASYYVGMGVAPNANLFVQRIFDDSGSFAFSNDTFVFWLANDAYRNGVYISQNSWGASTSGDYDVEASYYDMVTRDSSNNTQGDQPIIYVFAAGNDGPSAQTVGSPGTAKNVITVGATENYWTNPTSYGYAGYDTYTDNPEEMADFSSRGPTTDGRIKPDVVAPGRGIISARGSQASSTLWGVYDSYYLWCDGTSQATPQVSGAAADVVQWYLSQFGVKPTPTMVKAILINSAVDIQGGTNGGSDPIPNYEEGWGRVFLPTLLDPQVNVIYHDQDILLSTGDTYSMTVRVDDTSEPLKISLVWTDVAGNPSADPVLVNDLNLRVVAPDGTVYYGNGFTNGWSAPNTAAGNTNIGTDWDTNNDNYDDLNNVENVFIDANDLQTGEYTIEVIGYNIPQDAVSSTPSTDQDFALVCYNCIENTPPTMDITYPQKDDVLSGTVNVQWSASDAEDGSSLTIDLYYSTDNSTWNPIATGLSNTGTYSWDTTTLSDRQYYIRGVATDSQGATGEDIEGPFWIDNVASPPTVDILAPLAGAVLAPGNPYDILWSAQDQDPTGSISSIDIYVSYDGGATWSPIATGLSNTGAYTWNVPDGYANNVYIRVVATDNDGMQGDDTEGPMKISAKLFFQVQDSDVAGFKNLSFEPLEDTQKEISADIPAPGEVLLGKWITDAMAEDYNLKGTWEFGVYGRSVGDTGGFMEAKVYDYNGGNPVLLFTAQDDENISAYTDYHLFYWTYDYSGHIVNSGGQVYVEIYLNATKGGSVVETSPNPGVDTDSTGWSYADISDSRGTVDGTWQSSGGNPDGYLEINAGAPTSGSSSTVYTLSGYWEVSFAPSQAPTMANLYFDWTCTAFGSGQDSATIYVYIETASGTPSSSPVYQVSVSGTSSWASVGPVDVSSVVNSATTYYLKLAFEVTGVQRGEGPSWTVGFDNAYVEYGTPSQIVMGYDYTDTPSYVVMPWVESHLIYGYVTYSDGTPVNGALVNVTDMRTGVMAQVYTDGNGYYEYDISWLDGGYISGDTVNVSAYDSATQGKGYNEASVDTSQASQQLDIQLGTTIPEFSHILLIVLGVAVLLIYRRRR